MSRRVLPEYRLRCSLSELPAQVASVGRYKSQMATIRTKKGLFSLPIWSFKIYNVEWNAKEQPDGSLVVQPLARLASYDGRTISGFAPSALFIKECKQRAAERGVAFVPDVRHNEPIPRALIEQTNEVRRRHRFAAARPHGLCEHAGRCVEHERDPRVEPCNAKGADVGGRAR